MEILAKFEAFVTLKLNLADNRPCRLINPAKPEMGMVSKRILDRVVTKKLGEKVSTNLWKNTASVLEWYNEIDQKARHTCVVFDIIDFYASITEDLLRKAISFAQQHVEVSKLLSLCTQGNLYFTFLTTTRPG